MRSRRLTSLALITLMLLPAASVSAFDEGDMRRLEAASRRAHAEHRRVMAQAARDQARILAQARAHREQSLRQARAAHARLVRDAKAEARRLRREARAAKRALKAERRAIPRRAPTRSPCEPARDLSRRARRAPSSLPQLSIELHIGGVERPEIEVYVADEGAPFGLDEALEGLGLDDALEGIDLEEALEGLELDEALEGMDLEEGLEGIDLEEGLEGLDLEEGLEVLERLESAEALELEPEIVHESVVEEEPVEELVVESAAGPDGDFGEVEWAIIARINEIRRARGLSELAYDPRLQAAAMNHSAEMHRMNYFSHTSPTHGRESLKERIQLEGIGNFRSAGENLAMGPDIGDIAERFVQMWMDSPGHRDNILTEGYRFTGVGVYGERERVYATQLFSEAVTRSFN